MECICFLYMLISTFLISVTQQQALFTETQKQQLQDDQLQREITEKLWPLVDEYATNALNDAMVELRQKFLAEIDLLSDEIDNIADQTTQVEEAMRNMSYVPDAMRLGCPQTSDGLYLLMGMNCFMFRDERLTWNQAKAWCELRHGHLARPTSVEINEYLKKECRLREKQYWIGGHDRDWEGRWLWDNGTPIPSDVFDWAPGEPNDWGPGQDCLGIGQDDLRKWDDKQCDYKLGYCCQTAAINIARK